MDGSGLLSRVEAGDNGCVGTRLAWPLSEQIML